MRFAAHAESPRTERVTGRWGYFSDSKIRHPEILNKIFLKYPDKSQLRGRMLGYDVIIRPPNAAFASLL
jgi:hypothetical protein